jgi:hypothetical protein
MPFDIILGPMIGKICSDIEKLEIEHKKSPLCKKATVSIGLAIVAPVPNTLSLTVIARAGQALYQVNMTTMRWLVKVLKLYQFWSGYIISLC